MNEPSPSGQNSDAAAVESEARIETLELKMMDLENTVQDLNEVILRQYRDIERLQLQQTELLTRVLNPVEDSPAPSAADELPPHY